jgi:predicted HTH domain antitoxin
MSTLHIPDDLLKQAGITEQEALIELACQLFDTGRLSLFFAAKLAQMPQQQFEDLLLERRIPLYRYTETDLDDDRKSLRRMGS